MTFATENPLESALGRLHAVAAETIQMHAGHAGRCAACGKPSPCEQAILADHNLELTASAGNVTAVRREPTRIAQG